MNKKTRAVIQYMVFFVLGALILYLSYINFSAAYLEDCRLKGIPEGECSLIDKLITDFRTASFGWLILIMVLFLFSNVFRTWRWKQLLKPLGYNPSFLNTFAATMIGYFANLGLPRLGEVVKPGILTKYEQVPIETGIGTIVTDRILDVLALMIITGIALLVAFPTFSMYFEENFSMERSTSLMYLAGFVAMGGLMAYLLNRLIRSGNASHPMTVRLQAMWIGFIEGLTSLRRVDNFPFLIFNSVMIWLNYYLMTYICFFAFAPTEHLGPVAGLVVLVFGTLGIVFPSPGGMGSYHFLVTQALIIYGINSADAFSFSNIIFFSIQIFCNILIGALFVFMLPFINKSQDVR